MKKEFIILGIVVAAVAAGVVVFAYDRIVPQAAVQNYAPPKESTKVSFRELAHGDQAEITVRVNYLITSTSELSELWALIDAKGQPPPVDFKTDHVIALFAGKQPTIGHKIEVSQVADSDMRMVSLTLSKPGASCLSAKKVTAPYQVVQLPKTTLTLTHEDKIETISCLR